MNDLHSATGSYVCDALEDHERVAFEEHLKTCQSCIAEVVELREALATLDADVTVLPPPALRADVLSAVAKTPMLPADRPEDVRPPATITSLAAARRRRGVSTWFAAAAAVLAIGLGGVALWQQGTVASLQAAESRRVEVLGAPDLQVNHATLEGSAVVYLVSASEGNGVFAAADLPDPGPERSWQVWVMQDDVPRSSAVIDRGGAVQELLSGVAGGEALAITNEPRGGSPAPTGTVLADVVLEA